mmetsp:Transcript_6346/g.18155  ORF Transcript_6346/g.18155 Transcript_6346/m.18155 type:complete len:360 (+) Transcript_6346:326-1405(+)
MLVVVLGALHGLDPGCQRVLAIHLDGLVNGLMGGIQRVHHRPDELQEGLLLQVLAGLPLHLGPASLEECGLLGLRDLREVLFQRLRVNHAKILEVSELRFDQAVRHPSPKLGGLHHKVSDCLPDRLARKGGLSCLVIDVQDDGQHQVQEQQHHEQQERPRPKCRGAEELGGHLSPIVLALHRDPEASAQRARDRSEAFDTPTEDQAAGDDVGEGRGHEDDQEMTQVRQHVLHRVQHDGQPRLRPETHEEAEHQHDAVLRDDDAQAAEAIRRLLALVEEGLDLPDAVGAKRPTLAVHRLQRADERGLPHEFHVVVPVQHPPAAQDHQPLPTCVQIQQMKEQLGLQERFPHFVQPVCCVQY